MKTRKRIRRVLPGGTIQAFGRTLKKRAATAKPAVQHNCDGHTLPVYVVTLPGRKLSYVIRQEVRS